MPEADDRNGCDDDGVSGVMRCDPEAGFVFDDGAGLDDETTMASGSDAGTETPESLLSLLCCPFVSPMTCLMPLVY